MSITYIRKGEQMLPDLAIPEEPIEVKGIWAIRRRNFLREERRPVYYSLLTSCQLAEHLVRCQQEAEEIVTIGDAVETLRRATKGKRNGK